MWMNDLISIIVPVYKVEEYMDECVHSLVNQTYTNLEIILVDDGSPDKCPAMCDAWAEKDSRIRVIHKPNGGVSDARNAGLSQMLGTYCMMVDSDDYIDKTMVEKLHHKICNRNADIAVCGYYDLKGQHVTSPYTAGSELLFDDDQKFLSLYKECQVLSCNKLFVASLFKDLRYERLYSGEDAVLMVQLFDRAKRIVFISEPLYYYRYREGSAVHSAIKARTFDACVACERSLAFYSERNLVKAYSRCLFIYFYMLGDILWRAQEDKADVDRALIEKYTCRLEELYRELMLIDIAHVQKLKILLKQRYPRIYYAMKSLYYR